MYLRWDNRDTQTDGMPVWAATHGEMTVPVTDFVDAVRAFNDALLAAMRERVQDVLAGGLPPDIAVDLPHLQHEQRDRATWLDNRLSRREPVTDWNAVRAAVETINRSGDKPN